MGLKIGNWGLFQGTNRLVLWRVTQTMITSGEPISLLRFEPYTSHIGLSVCSISATPDSSVKVHLFLLLSLSDPFSCPKVYRENYILSSRFSVNSKTASVPILVLFCIIICTGHSVCDAIPCCIK
jgi:hypothetical protein